MVYNCRQVIRLAGRSSSIAALGSKREGKKKRSWITAASSRPMQPSGKSSLCSPTLCMPLRHGGGESRVVCVEGGEML